MALLNTICNPFFCCCFFVFFSSLSLSLYLFNFLLVENPCVSQTCWILFQGKKWHLLKWVRTLCFKLVTGLGSLVFQAFLNLAVSQLLVFSMFLQNKPCIWKSFNQACVRFENFSLSQLTLKGTVHPRMCVFAFIVGLGSSVCLRHGKSLAFLSGTVLH